MRAAGWPLYSKSLRTGAHCRAQTSQPFGLYYSYSVSVLVLIFASSSSPPQPRPTPVVDLFDVPLVCNCHPEPRARAEAARLLRPITSIHSSQLVPSAAPAPDEHHEHDLEQYLQACALEACLCDTPPYHFAPITCNPTTARIPIVSVLQSTASCLALSLVSPPTAVNHGIPPERPETPEPEGPPRLRCLCALRRLGFDGESPRGASPGVSHSCG